MKAQIAINLNDQDEVFTHKDDDGIFRHFAVTAMNTFAMQYTPLCPDITAGMVPITKDVAEHSRTKMGVEPVRLAMLKAPYLYKPLIAIQWPGIKAITIVDGHHRVVKLWQMGEKSMKVFIFHHPFWEQFMIPIEVEDKRELLKIERGIREWEK